VDGVKNLRNVLIVLLIAGAVYAIPGGGRAASTVEAVLLVGIGLAIGFLGLRLYRERRMWLFGLGDRYRALLYGSVAAGFIAIAGRQRMWETGVGELVWFLLVGFVVYGVLAVLRHARSY
jgi:hypothetical protein